MQSALNFATRKCAVPPIIVAIGIGVVFLASTRGWAITVSELDDFQAGTAEGWGWNRPVIPADVPEDEGPTGVGDFALQYHTMLCGCGGRLVVHNLSQWLGNWTAAGITQIKLDVRNPNAFPLTMRLGISGPGGVEPFGGGNTYITSGMSVPVGDAWHPLTFGVVAADWTSTGGMNIAAALASVTEFRIFHNPANAYVGDQVVGGFFLDNIRAVFPGDYNRNNAVDMADYVIWRDTLEMSGPNLAADGTGPTGAPDGTVNGLDYDFWRARFGNTPPTAGSAVAAATVPEPESASLILLFAAGTCFFVGRPCADR